jgi:hypothetical protein
MCLWALISISTLKVNILLSSKHSINQGQQRANMLK